MKKTLLFALGLFHFCFANSQTFNEAVQYSKLNAMGTARNLAVGGSMAALGGDMTNTSINPAGIAVYRASELNISMGLRHEENDGLFQEQKNSTRSNSTSHFIVSNAGGVFHRRLLSSSWRASNIGISYNRVASFKQTFEVNGNTNGSITERFVELANGIINPIDFDPFESLLAWDVGAIYDGDVIGDYTSDFLESGVRSIDKNQRVERKGSIHDINLSFAGNLKDKLMLGASLGIPILSFSEERMYREDDSSETIPFLDFLEFNERLKSNSVGVNLKLGAIYHISPRFRWAAYIHTPTKYILSDTFSTNITNQFNDGSGPQRLSSESLTSDFEYSLSSPWRFGTGIGIVFKKRGFISLDAEFVDFKQLRYNLVNLSSNPENQETQDILNDEFNTRLDGRFHLRGGGELVLKKFRIRAGVNYMPDPREGVEDIWALSTGSGYRGKRLYLDIAFRISLDSDSGYAPYSNSSSVQPQATIRSQEQIGLITIGYRY